MAARRLTPEQLDASAAEAASAALELVGIRVIAEESSGSSADAMLRVVVDDRPFRVTIHAAAYVTRDRAEGLVARSSSGRAGDVFPLVVADRITADARDLLNDAGWSWLDRRGWLHLRGPAVRVDLEVAPEARLEGTRPRQAIRGRAGLTVAYWLCANPASALSPTKDAPKLGLAPSTVSTTARQLADAGLLDNKGTAVLPELFWELAESWGHERKWLAQAPDPAHWRSSDPDAPTWRRTGTAAAAAYGAPVVTTAIAPIELYVPGPVVQTIAARRYGPAEPGMGAAAIAVAPVRQICTEDARGPALDGWDAAPLLAVALDLAQDRARGRQILEEWKAGDRVWR